MSIFVSALKNHNQAPTPLCSSCKTPPHISTDCTNLCWYVIDHDNPVFLAHSMHDFALLILTWAAVDITFHFSLFTPYFSFIILCIAMLINRPIFTPVPEYPYE